MAISLYIESTTIDSVNLKWSDSANPGDAHEIWRSSDGVSYTFIVEAAAGETTAQDSGLEPETRYWYKIVDGATTSNIASVVTQACAPSGAARDQEPGGALPTADGEVDVDTFNAAMRELESIIRSGDSSNECVLCSVNGAIVLNCSAGCRNFVAEVTEDINSISIVGCEDIPDVSVTFEVPTGTWRICGFPANSGWSGNECFDAPVTGPQNITAGFRVGSGGPIAKTPSGSGDGATGGGGGGSPIGSPLTVTCQTIDGDPNTSCSMDCQGGKAMRFRILGGTPPYTTTTNSTATKATVSDGIISLTAPSSSAVAGVAYKKGFWQRCSDALNRMQIATYGCQDAVIDACGPNDANGALYNPSTCHFCGEAGNPSCGVGDTGTVNNNNTSHPCTSGAGANCFEAAPTQCDARTPTMISNGCTPCGTSMHGKTFTVTDSAGVSVVTVISS